MRITLDVSKPILTVEQHGLLLYPVLIYLIGQTLKKHFKIENGSCVRYRVADHSGVENYRTIRLTQRFDTFFKGYVRQSYQSLCHAPNIDENPGQGDAFALFSAEKPLDTADKMSVCIEQVTSDRKVILGLNHFPISTDFEALKRLLQTAFDGASL